MCEETVVAYFKALCQRLLGNREKQRLSGIHDSNPEPPEYDRVLHVSNMQ